MELIILHPHDPGWKIKFKNEKARLTELMGPAARSIEHVGSTAVPGLLAKPVIDIAIEIVSYPPAQDVIEKLAAIGYLNEGEAGVPGRTWFIKGTPRECHLHFCPAGSDMARKQIAFRDKLIQSESLRKEYENVKRNSFRDRDIDDAAYAAAKTAIILKAIG